MNNSIIKSINLNSEDCLKIEELETRVEYSFVALGLSESTTCAYQCDLVRPCDLIQPCNPYAYCNAVG